MPGGREITGADVLAALRVAGAPRRDAPVRPDDVFGSYEDLLRACPPARVGLSPGAHAAALAPLFGEFE
jgi:hypothetical protein